MATFSRSAKIKKFTNDIKPQVLLDFDGVLLRSKKAANIIKKGCASYVGTKMNSCSSEQATAMNAYLYNNFGHTVIGLKALGYASSLEEFNDYIYNTIDYHDIYEDINKMGAFDVSGLEYLLDTSDGVYIFSNAPYTWVYNIMNACCPNDILNKTKYYDTLNCLKPNLNLYNEVYTKLSRSDEEQLIFIDDSIKNFEMILNDDRFHCMLFNPNIDLDVGNIQFVTKLTSYHYA